MLDTEKKAVRREIFDAVESSCRICSFFGWSIYTQCRKKNPYDRCEACSWNFEKLNEVVDEIFCEYLLWIELEEGGEDSV